MEKQTRVMNTRVRFSNLLAPVLTDGLDSATVALLASRILETQRVRDVDVIPLSHTPELSENTLYAIRAGFADWHAVRLLIDQGKLPPDPRIHVRVHLNQEQWDKAGEIALEAAEEHQNERYRQIKRRSRRQKLARQRRQQRGW